MNDGIGLRLHCLNLAAGADKDDCHDPDHVIQRAEKYLAFLMKAPEPTMETATFGSGYQAMQGHQTN